MVLLLGVSHRLVEMLIMLLLLCDLHRRWGVLKAHPELGSVDGRLSARSAASWTYLGSPDLKLPHDQHSGLNQLVAATSDGSTCCRCLPQ